MDLPKTCSITGYEGKDPIMAIKAIRETLSGNSLGEAKKIFDRVCAGETVLLYTYFEEDSEKAKAMTKQGLVLQFRPQL